MYDQKNTHPYPDVSNVCISLVCLQYLTIRHYLLSLFLNVECSGRSCCCCCEEAMTIFICLFSYFDQSYSLSVTFCDRSDRYLPPTVVHLKFHNVESYFHLCDHVPIYALEILVYTLGTISVICECEYMPGVFISLKFNETEISLALKCI